MKSLAYTPQWFTAVMGTAIIATATGALPFDAPFLHLIGDMFWIASVLLLVLATGYMVSQYWRDRGLFMRELRDPKAAPFFGALAMAPLAVGGATLAVGPRFLGDELAVTMDEALWVIGTILAVGAAIVVPAMQFTSERIALDAASPAWLLPVVAPMVSATTGAMLVDRIDSPGAAQAMAFTSLALFGASGLAALLMTGTLWWKMAHHPLNDPAQIAPLWIVLGPLGQSTTAIAMLAIHASTALGMSTAALSAAAIVYGVPVMGFALLWLATSLAVGLRIARGKLPYAMTWWSFTFPVGTCVTGAAGLAAVTGAAIFAWLAAVLFVLLLAGWTVAAWGTARALLRRRAVQRASDVPHVPAYPSAGVLTH
ncbi:hypothetical protein [Demequina sediminicola]|uniref:SLAC1 family transporter n=1 Tax=Demequina sediminicola TaxID=1095026 RepID=UPI0007834F1D|nr:hypothetical protein [Demequina sediminicola]